jgi:RNA methyltransferase, TrmH family
VGQVISSHPAAIEEVLIDEGVVDASVYSGFFVRALPAGKLKTIAASMNPQGVVAVIRLPEGYYQSTLPSSPGKRIVLLEDIQDPGNVGTIIRTAVAFGFGGVLLSRKCADPFSPKVVQASAGAILVPWIRRDDNYMEYVEQLKMSGHRLLCADVRGKRSISFSQIPRMIIAFGNEGTGLSSRLSGLADDCFAIPMERNSVESLNVAVSGAITLFAAFRQSGW